MAGNPVDTTYTRRYDSWGEFVDAAEHGDTDLPDNARSSRSRNGFHGAAWSGTDTFEEAIELARYGWVEGARRLHDEVTVFQSHLPVKRQYPELVFSEVGPGTLDLHRYVIGHPQPWVTWQDTRGDSRDGRGGVVKVVFNGAASSGVSVQAMFEKGAAIASLVDHLERARYRVELIMGHSIYSYQERDNRLEHLIMLKRPEDSLDLDRVAFGLAHAACLRRLIFSIDELEPRDIRDQFGIGNHGSYGYPTDVTADETKEDEHVIVIPSSSLVDRNYKVVNNNKDARRAWLAGYLEPFGIELEND